MFSENKVYLPKRNLLTLLSKLGRFEASEDTKCEIIKHFVPLDPYCMSLQSEESISIIAIPDSKYYTNREPGRMHPEDDPTKI